jgi:hypothetical protein
MPSHSDEETMRQRQAVLATTYFLHVVAIAAALYAEPNYWRQPYHTSALGLNCPL